MHSIGSELSGFLFLLIVQIIFIILFCIFVRYDDALLPDNADATIEQKALIEEQRRFSYPRKYTVSGWYATWY